MSLIKLTGRLENLVKGLNNVNSKFKLKYREHLWQVMLWKDLNNHSLLKRNKNFSLLNKAFSIVQYVHMNKYEYNFILFINKYFLL